MSDYVWVITINHVPTLDGYFLPAEFDLAQKISEKYSGNNTKILKVWKHGKPLNDSSTGCAPNCC